MLAGRELGRGAGRGVLGEEGSLLKGVESEECCSGIPPNTLCASWSISIEQSSKVSHLR